MLRKYTSLAQVQRALKSHRSKMYMIYMLSWKQCALRFTTTKALCVVSWSQKLCVVDHWWLLILGSLLSLLSSLWFIGTKCMSCHKAFVVITGRTHCFHDNTHTYIYIYIYIWTENWNLALTPCAADRCGSVINFYLHMRQHLTKYATIHQIAWFPRNR